MAKKMSAAAKRKAASTEAAVTKKQKVATAKTCLEKLEVEESPGQPARKRGRTDEQEIAKALRDNFPSWKENETDMTYRDGHTLRSRLKVDKDSGVPTGKFYYQALREQYAPADAPEKIMALLEPDAPEDPVLTSALWLLFQHNRNLGPLIEWFDSVQAVNQKVLRAAYRAMLKIPMTNFENASLVVSCLKMTKRLKLSEQEPATFACMKDHFDRALVKSIVHCRSHSQTVATWWRCFGYGADLLMPRAEVEACIACETNFVDVEAELRLVVTSSCAGMKLFCRAWDLVLQSSADMVVRTAIARLANKSFTVESLVAERTAVTADFDKIGKRVSDTFAARDVEVNYRGILVPCTVNSYLDMWSTMAEALMRTIAVDSQVMQPLWCENDLVGPRQLPNVRVAKSLVEASINARSSCAEMLTGLESQSGPAIKDILTKKQKFLRSIDRFFKIESALFFSSIGASSEARLKACILARMPTETVDKSIGESLAALDDLGKGKLIAFCGPMLQSTWSCVRGYVHSLSEDRSPKFESATENAFLIDVKRALSRFCVHIEPGASKGAAKLFGSAALKKKLEVVRALHDQGKAIPLSQLSVFHQFKWLMAEADFKVVKEITDRIAAPVVGAASSDEPPSKKRGSKGTSSRDAKAIVAELFS
jgi:hypothetical protein